MDKIRWGVLSTAKIGREKLIPAMQQGKYCRVEAIASRDGQAAANLAGLLGIPKAYGSYEDLLGDRDIDAVYIPLPNHLHVEWAIKALMADKHVLCEKPIGLSVAEAIQLQQAAREKPGLKLMEAFMYRFHPQWRHAKKLVDDGSIGELRTVHSFFSYNNTDPNNIRNRKETGGGGMMDIGCYCVSFARFIFGKEPASVSGYMEFDPFTKTDTLTSGMLDFTTGSATFTCSTRLMPYQRVNILGTEGRIEIEIPVNVPSDKAARIWLHTTSGSKEIVFDPVDQYTLQCDEFSHAILQDEPVPLPLEDAVNNMKLIEAIFKSAAEGNRVNIN
jgi:predicted dehydrogenase